MEFVKRRSTNYLSWLSVGTIVSSGWWYTNCRKGPSRHSRLFFFIRLDEPQQVRAVMLCNCSNLISTAYRIRRGRPEDAQHVRTTALCIYFGPRSGLSHGHRFLAQQRRDVLSVTVTRTKGTKICLLLLLTVQKWNGRKKPSLGMPLSPPRRPLNAQQ
jgi:hypothetical protein